MSELALHPWDLFLLLTFGGWVVLFLFFGKDRLDQALLWVVFGLLLHISMTWLLESYKLLHFTPWIDNIFHNHSFALASITTGLIFVLPITAIISHENIDNPFLMANAPTPESNKIVIVPLVLLLFGLVYGSLYYGFLGIGFFENTFLQNTQIAEWFQWIIHTLIAQNYFLFVGISVLYILLYFTAKKPTRLIVGLTTHITKKTKSVIQNR